MILVTGATGTVGRRVVEGLVRDGREVRAMVRSPEAAAGFEAMGVAALVGDVTRATDRAAALVQVDEVIACHSAYHDYAHQRISEVDGDATVALIEDAAAAGVKHFVLLSHLDAACETSCQHFVAKRRAELALLNQDRMFYSILRLAPLMDELLRLPGIGAGTSQYLLLFGPGTTQLSPISPDDVAIIARRAARIEGLRNETLDLGGPETYTWQEIPTVLQRVWGGTPTVVRLPLFLLTILRVVAGWIKPAAGERLAYLETLFGHDFVADPARAATLTDLGFEDLVSYLERRDGQGEPPPTVGDDEAPARHVESERGTRPLEDSEPEAELPERSPEPELPPEQAPAELEPEPERALEPRPLPEAQTHETVPLSEAPAAAVPDPLPLTEPVDEEPLVEVAPENLPKPPVAGSLASWREGGEPPPPPEPLMLESEPVVEGEVIRQRPAEPTPTEPLKLDPPVAGRDWESEEPPSVADPLPLMEQLGEDDEALATEPTLPEPPPLLEPLELGEMQQGSEAEGWPLPELGESAEPAEAEDEAAWGRHADFGDEPRPPVAPDADDTRPRVRRPQQVDKPVIDLDQEQPPPA